MSKGATKILVQFPPPITNLSWKLVKSDPLWAKNLERELPEGEYKITFIVKDPKSKLISSCMFKIIVDLADE